MRAKSKSIKKVDKKLKMHLDKDADCDNELCNRFTPGGCYMTIDLYYEDNEDQSGRKDLIGRTAKPRKSVDCAWKKKPTKQK